MRLIAVTRVKNEQDIIEAFVRHTLAHFDRLIVLDHSSTDRTHEILTSLVGEGLPLEVRQTAKLETQGAAMTTLMREAFGRFGADWMMPLDADEFVDTPAGSTLRDCLSPDARQPLAIRWFNYAYMPDASPTAPANNPAVALRWRAQGDSELRKVLVPRRAGMRQGMQVYEGNHALTRKGRWQAAIDDDRIMLCHFPVRSYPQYAAKIAIGSWRYLANPSNDGSIWGWHYKKAYGLLISGDRRSFEQQMHEDSINYSSTVETTLIECPMTYRGGVLRYSDEIGRETDFLRSVFSYAELLARDRAGRHDAPFFKRMFSRFRRTKCQTTPSQARSGAA